MAKANKSIKKAVKKAVKKVPKKAPAKATRKRAATATTRKTNASSTFKFTGEHKSTMTSEKATALMTGMRALLQKHGLTPLFKVANVQIAPADALGLQSPCDNCDHPRFHFDAHGNLICDGCDD